MANDALRIAAARGWLEAIARAIGLQASYIARSLVASRYKDAGLASFPFSPSICADAALPENAMERFKSRARSLVSTHISRLPDRSVMLIMMKDYFEIVAFNVLDKKHVFGFFDNCFLKQCTSSNLVVYS